MSCLSSNIREICTWHRALYHKLVIVHLVMKFASLPWYPQQISIGPHPEPTESSSLITSYFVKTHFNFASILSSISLLVYFPFFRLKSYVNSSLTSQLHILLILPPPPPRLAKKKIFKYKKIGYKIKKIF
jgi:hypothetical protein